MKNLKLEVGNAPYLRAASSYVRMNVFVFENKMEPVVEFDEYDTSETIYSVIFDGALPVATARFLPQDETEARITRVATLKEYRGNHLGAQVVTALEAFAKEENYQKIIIHSELVALAFYESLGYQVEGDTYIEDGVDCVSLVKELK